MAKPKGLGRGLDALLGSDVLSEPQNQPSEDSVVQIPISQIDPNRDQPRRQFNESALKDLAESIESVGVIQPILVYASDNRYTIIAGERRWRAARLAGLEEIPAIVRDWDDVRRMQVALIENLQRDDLNPVEQAMGVQSLMEQYGFTQEAVSKQLGKSRSAIANLLRLLNLPEPILDMLRDGRLSAGHGRALVNLPADRQIQLAELAVQEGWSVRQLERAAQLQPKNPSSPPSLPRPAEFNELERMAREVFGTKAQITGTEKQGKLVLQYHTPDDLQRIWELLEFIRQSGA